MLIFCPGGLCRNDILPTFPDWDKWVDILKDRNLIKVSVVSKIEPNEDYEGEENDLEERVFKVDSTLASFILNDMNKEEIDRYVSFLCNLM